jgi:hypothetical protein
MGQNAIKRKNWYQRLETLKVFLGIEIAHSLKDLFISQRKYTLNLLRETGKIECKSTFTSIDNSNKLNTEDGETLKNINQFNG